MKKTSSKSLVAFVQNMNTLNLNCVSYFIKCINVKRLRKINCSKRRSTKKNQCILRTLFKRINSSLPFQTYIFVRQQQWKRKNTLTTGKFVRQFYRLYYYSTRSQMNVIFKMHRNYCKRQRKPNKSKSESTIDRMKNYANTNHEWKMVYEQIASVCTVDDLKSLHFLFCNNKHRTVLLCFMRWLLRYKNTFQLNQTKTYTGRLWQETEET